MSRVDEVRRFIDEVYRKLESVSYYDLLGVEKDAPHEKIQQAFYQRAGQLHPDRYFKLMDAPLRERLIEVYARISEAYKILSDPTKRPQYDRGLAEGKARFVAATEREVRKATAPEERVSNREAKRFTKLAFTQLTGGDYKGALMNLRLALSLEGANREGKDFLQEQIRLCEEKAKRPVGGSA